MTSKPGIPLNEPQTETGRETLADPYFAPPLTPFYDRLRDAILAIEREARGIPLIDVEPLERLIYDLYGEHDRHRIGHPEHRGTCQDARPHPHDLARRLSARLASESSVPVEGRYGAITGDGYAPGQKIPHNPDWSRCEAPGCHESFLLYGQHEAGLPVEEGERR